MEENMHYGALSSRVHERLEHLSKKERSVAEYMLAHQEKLIYSSITDLAEQSDTSEATITRLCTKLGYRGFQALKLSVARDLVPPQDQIHEELSQDDPAEVIIEKIFDSAIQTLSMTKKNLDKESVRRSIDALTRCGRLVIMGSGNSGAIAKDAQHKFLRLGMNVHAYADGHMQMIAVSSLGWNDVALGISHSGSSKDIAEAMELARERGATTISITSNGVSPLSRLADIQLYTYSQETKYRTYAISSRMAELTIIDTLYIGVSLRLGDAAIEHFEALDKALIVKKY